MVDYTSFSNSTGVLTVLELLIVGIDDKLLVLGSELLGSALALSLDKKKSNVHDQLSFSLLHVLIVYTEKFGLSMSGGPSPPSPPLPHAYVLISNTCSHDFCKLNDDV